MQKCFANEVSEHLIKRQKNFVKLLVSQVLTENKVVCSLKGKPNEKCRPVRATKGLNQGQMGKARHLAFTLPQFFLMQLFSCPAISDGTHILSNIHENKKYIFQSYALEKKFRAISLQLNSFSSRCVDIADAEFLRTNGERRNKNYL